MATLKELYDALKSDGAPLPETYEKFKNYMTSGPGGGYEHRKKVYDSLKSDGAPLPDTYEAFSKSLFSPAAKPSPRSGHDEGGFPSQSGIPSQSLEHGTAGQKPSLPLGNDQGKGNTLLPSGNDAEASESSLRSDHNKGQQEHEEQQKQQQEQQVWKPTPMQKAFMMGRIREDADATIGDMRQRVDNTRRLAQSQTEEGRNLQKAAEMQARTAGTPTKVLGLSSYTPSSGGGEAGASPSQNPNSPVVHGVRLENGEAKTEWMLPDGSLSTSFIDADKAEYGARKARLQYEFLKRMEENGLDPANSDDVEKQKRKDLLDVSEKRTRIRLAENEENLRELNDRKAERLDADGEWRDDEGFWQNFVRIVGGAAGRSVTANVRRPETSLTQEDRERGTYLAENQVLEEARKQLETRRLNKSEGFMGGFWKLGNNWRNMKMAARHTLSDADLYSGGVMALQKATRLTDIEEKLGRGEDLTDAEVSLVYSTMLEQDVRDNTETPHGYNAMQITVEMFPFMAQMLLNPASGLSRAMVTKFGKAGLRKIATRKATQGLAGEAAEAFAKKEMRKLAAKTIGVQVAGDVAEATVLANTLQAPKTAADAIGRYQGNVTEDENGNLSFDGSHDWGEAVYKAESAAIIENYTEMLGEHFGIIGNAIGKGVGKGLRAIGGGKVVDAVSDMIGKINSSEWVKAISEVEKRAHWNGTVGEVLEEEAGIVLNSIFTGDNSISDLWDADQQIDIVLGVGLFGGFVSGLKTIGYPLSKTKAKSSLRKSDGIGSWRFGDEWGDIRDRIDNAEEKDLGAVIRDLVRTHAKSEEQGKAIVDYAHALMRSRGFEIASASARSEGTVSPEQQDVEDSFEHGEQLAEGSDPQAMNDAKREMERARQKFVNSSSEDFVSGHFDGADAVDNLLNLGPDPELRQQAADYINAKAVYEGMIQRVRDDVDGRVAQSDAMIESRVNRETGMIQPAVYGPDKKTVYIINGTVAMSDDGSGIDTSGSSESVIIRDAETGKVEFADPRHFVSVEEGIDAEAEKEAARAQIIDEVAVTAANSIDGVLPMTPGDTYTVADDEGNRQEVSVLGETADENGMPVGGSVDIQYPDGTIQSIETSELQERADVAAEGRVADFAEERDAEREKAAVSDSRPQHGEESGLDNPGRRTDLMPDDYKTPYDNRPVRATRYIESENGTGGTLYQDENGNDAVVIAAIDNNNYVGYFREYDEQGNPTNRWSAKFQNGSGIRENHRDMMLTAQELLPAGHELTEHTSVSTDGLRNLANQLKHGYELQYDEQGNIVTTEVAVNMMARDNALGLSDYEPGSIDPARVSSEEYKEAASRLIPYMEALGLSKFNIHWEDGTMYVDHPILKRADTPQQEVQPVVTENAETVPNSDENTEIPTENRDLATENVPKTEKSVENVQQTADDGFIPIDPALINSRTDENGNIIWDEPRQEQTQTEEPKQSALSRVPLNEKGKPDFGAVDADTAWDAIVEKTTNEAMAQSFADNMVAASEAELKKAEKVKTKPTTDIDEFIAADTERIANIDRAKTALDHWKKVAGTKQRRQAEEDAVRSAEMRKRAEEARVKAEQERAEREEAERIEREALNGVPDWSRDTPQDARARGYRRNGPQKVDRQENVTSVQGKEIEVKFSDKELPKGHAAIIDAGLLQPSHIQGSRNPLHFLDEAQPKERDDAASVLSAQKIASNIRPEEITSSVTAYTGAPTVNLRGETIQGNSRSDALRLMYESRPEQAARYKQYLIDHAADFGLTPEQISSVENPVLVNMLDVADDEAIRLGQFVAQDTESGGIERIKPKNAVQKMGNRLGSFSNILLGSMDDEASLSQLIEANGVETLKWMSRNGFITDTQYGSAFDSKGELSAKAAEDLKGILYQSVFTGGSTRLEEMFNKLPAKAQRAILATAFRDFDSRREDSMVGELQQSIIAFYDISFYEPFASATNLKDAMDAALAWSRQYAFDDVSGESVLPAEKFSNFALRLAAIYRGGTQKFIQQTFNDLYDAVQGTAQDTLFEEADKTPKSLSEAIRKVLDMEYQPVKRNEDGENRGNAVDVDSPQGEAGRPGVDGDASVGERDEEREESADGRGGAPEDSGRRDDVTADTAGESSLRSDHDGEFPGAELGTQDSRADTEQDEEALLSRIEVKDDDWAEGGGYTPTLRRTVVVDGTHEVIQVDAPDRKGNYMGSVYEYDGRTFGDLREVVNHIDGRTVCPVCGKAHIPDYKSNDVICPQCGTDLSVFRQIDQLSDEEKQELSDKFIGEDNQGNPIDHVGKLIVEEVKSIDEITDEDFTNPSRTVELPILPSIVQQVLSTNGKKVIIKKNIFKRNALRHDELSPEMSRTILKESLYNPTLYGKNRPLSRPNNWIVINIPDGKGNNKLVVLEINERKDNVEIVHWHEVDNRGLEKIKRQAEREDGQLLILPSETSEEAGALSGPTFDLPSDGKDNTLSSDKQDVGAESSDLSSLRSDHDKDALHDQIRQWLGMKGLEPDEASRSAVMRYFKIGYDRAGKILDAITKDKSANLDMDKLAQKAKSVKWITMFEETPEGLRIGNRKSLVTYRFEDYDGKRDGVEAGDYLADDIWTNMQNRTEHDKNMLLAAKDIEGYCKLMGIPFRGYTQEHRKWVSMAMETLANEKLMGEVVIPYFTARAKRLGYWDSVVKNLQERMRKRLRNDTRYLKESPDASLEENRGYNERLLRSGKAIAEWLGMTDVAEAYENAIARENAAKQDKGIPMSQEEAPLSLADMQSAIKPEETNADKTESSPAEPKAKNPSGNRLVTDERYAELRERMRRKFGGQLNMGIDPEILAIGTEMAVYHIERGARKFKEYASAMIADLGDAIRPYLKSFYNAVRDMPEAETAGLVAEMDSYDEVRSVDVANFDKESIDAMATAEMVVGEEAADQERKEAEKKLKEERNIRLNPDGSTTETINEGGTEIEVTRGDFIPGVRPSIEEPSKPGKRKSGKKEAKTTSGSLFDNIDEVAPLVIPERRPVAELAGDSAAYQEREAQTVELTEEISGAIENLVEMLQVAPEAVKPLTMSEVKKMAAKYPALKGISDTDLQELVELAMTQLTRSEALINIDGTAEQQRSAYNHIVNLYRMQPSLNARDSERLIKQQYSTPTPFGFVMGQFVRAGGKKVGSMLEPSAGNGALTITVNPSDVHVNDIDDVRLANLRKLGYGKVTAQDGRLPFDVNKVDVVMTNPPFGTVAAERVYDGIFKISSLEGQMAINALDSMKDGGRAAIIIGGNTSYRTNGSMNPKDAAFFGYLYSHYNVADVINISGKALYARNGTGYDVRMILIDGRKTGEFERVYPPVRSKARAEQITTFDELYDRVQYDIQQIQQVGRESADVQREPGAAVDGTTGADVRGGNHLQDKGAGERPDATSDGVGSTSGTSIGQPTPGNGGSRSAGMDNGDRGNARSTDNVQRPKSPASGGSRSGSTQNDEGRSGGNRRDTTPSGHNNNGERLAVKPDLTAEKVPYPNQSDNGFTLLSVVPAAQAEVLQRSLGEIGDVDRFLVEELGYSSKEELYSFLAAEQIDSVALAIHQMNKGNAFIIGDMTGVGKGRQGAALIRYAVKQGKCPIYFTQKPTLFSDNYRDLADIGSSELRPFIIASNPKDANIVDANGNVVHKLPSKKEQERVFNYIMQNGKLPKEYDYVLTTYDQIKNGTADYTQNEDGSWNTEARKLPKKSKGYTTADYNGQARRDALARLAMGVSSGRGNIAILDESHTVGGDSGCGRYMQMLTSKAYGVTFLSATFAKRADNMPIYAQRTAISEAGVKANELIEAIAKGGVTLQEIMSKQLVESGQMIRRERSFEGVTIDWLSVEEETNRRQREQFNEVADIFNSIRNFQNDFIKPIIDGMNEAAAERGATVGQTQGTKDMGVRNTPFASKMYNLVNQLLFALKVDAVADRVIENLRNGFKPVISFTNTMEGFLASAPKGVAMDEVPNFSLTLMRALDGVMRFTENDADQNSEGGRITLGQLSADGQAAYNAVKEKIMNLSADLPISPMDAIRMKIEEAGYSVAEITGRTTQLNRTEDGRYIVEGRKDRDKKAAMRDFNSGKLDVLMINKSGSTGISLHASSKFEDQRQRVMVFAQFQSDINDEVQMRGRIDRSGQVVRGRYEYIMSTIPAEQRIQMMFKAKLKSLDANTTSSQKSKFNEMEIVDYLNKYGDEVVWEYMREHPELSERLGDPLKMLKEKEEDGSARTSENEDMSQKADCAGKISRYLAFLSVEEQDEIFREITEAYKVKIQLLDDAGENDLEITTMPLRAETKSKQIWHRGENPGSGNAFADNTYVEEVEVDVLKKPMKRAEIEEMTRKLMGDKVATATEYDQMRYGMKEGELNWRRYADRMVEEVNTFFGNKVDEAIDKMKEAGAKRVAKAREKSVKDALKARTKGENTFSDQEIESLADVVAREAQDREEHKQNKRREEINAVRDHIKRLLGRLKAGHIYVVPQDLKQASADMFTQSFGTFVGFKFNKSYTLGSSTAIFATLDGRRKVELALNDKAIETIIRCTETVQRYSPKEINAVSMDNWDSKVPSQTRQKRHIITGNLLQALVDTGKGEKTRGNLISFSTMEGDTRQGILMSENFKPTDLRSSVPLRSRLKQIQDGMTVVSESGDVRIEKITMGWEHRGDYELRVPKSKQKGGQYTMHPGLLKLVDGKNFVTKGNNMVGYVAPENIAKVLDMLSQAPFNLTVLEESKLSEAKEDEGVRFRSGDNEDLLYRIREEEPPTKTGIGYKVFVLKNGMLYPPMVANPNGDATPVGVWLDADAAPVAGTSKTGRMQVKAGGKGTQGGSGKLAYRPGWHLGVIPYALQFNRKGESGEKELFPANFVWAEVEYADDIDYQEEAMSYGYNKNGKFQHSYAGLPRLPINGAYKYRTNPNPETDPWIITGAMKVKRLLTPSEVDEMVIAAGREPQKRQDRAITDEEINDLNAQLAQSEREGSGEYRDAEASTDKDPWSIEWGEAMRENRRQRQHEEMERERMREQASALSARLGVEIEIVDDAASLRSAHDGELSARDVERRQRAKGWYDPRTGKITVVVGNHSSASDMEATILHEAVAHHGLRELLGEHFDEFLDKVYDAAENGIKERIDLLATRNGWNRRVATEEYLAGLAEQTDFERAKGGWFDRIKRFFIDMLRKVGFKNITPESIGDNEFRYVLWRSYQNLVNPGQHRAFEWEAEDVARQYELGVGDFAPEAVSAPDENTVLFRDGDFTPRDRVMVADEYERMLSRGRWQFQEAVQDSMLGLKALYESILTEGGKSRRSAFRIDEVAGYENAYLYENRMSSANNGEQHQYFVRFMKPLLESIHELCGSNKLQRRILTDYMMAKHGLERNEYMRNEAASNGEETERDFAGLCGLTGQAGWQKAESVAQQMVDDYEADHDTAELWSNVRKATGETLEKIYLSGLISEDTYNKVLGMYDFYIPLRGWDETTSDEVYGYLTSKDGPLTGSVFKSAEGRESKADDPIATIAMMADDAIRQGNRNIMKQRFLNFVHGHPSDLVSVNELWLQHDDVTGIWEPVFADLQPDMTRAEVENEIAKFEARMEALRSAEPDKYKKGREARNIPYKVVRGNLNEHQVLVKRNGRTYIMTINGNPRAAQALNGLTNPDVEAGGVIGGLLKLGEYVNRNLSAFYTTRNPDFVVSNFLRDMLYSNCMTWVKENPRYALRFHRNFGRVNPMMLRRLLSRWEKDTLSDGNYLERMFKEFMLNGGETGYTSVKDIEGHKRTVAKELRKRGSIGRKAWNALGMQFELLNRSAENCARFAAFLTSREMGRTLDRSIYDAKEVSVNFNKKGSGGKFVDATGQKLLGKIGSHIGGWGRVLFVFWNAGVQGLTNFGRAGKRNPGKALGGATALFTLGCVIPLLAKMLGGGDGDDDDKNAYYNLPEYVRRSNICFKAGDQWITIPLPIEYRAIYGMGELASGVISGNERYGSSELTRQMAAQISQIMPLDMLEGGGGISPFIPSAFKPLTEAYILNRGWTGLPVSKDTPFNKNDPEWTKAYQSADQHLVAFAKWLNETTGGDDYKKGAIDINPAKLEYLLSGTFGGVVSTVGKLKKMGETAFGDREFEWRNMLLANRVIKSGDERTANRKLQNEYFKYKKEYEETGRLLKKYENADDAGILGYAERADFLYNSEEYLRYGIFEEYKPDIDEIREGLKDTTDPEIKKELQNELYATMRELVNALHSAGKSSLRSDHDGEGK